MAKVALIGDYNPSVTAHQAIPKALGIAADQLGIEIGYEWIDSPNLVGDLSEILAPFDGVWAVPASPYENMVGVIQAIEFARVENIPFFGTCGGYQHAVLEFARNVLGLTQADNAEVNPSTEFPLIAPLVCALVEQDGQIQLVPDSQAADLYGTETITEQYRCSYGFNLAYVHLFDDSALSISGFDNDQDPRIIELAGNRFFMGTAFQPERAALRGENHPVVSAFVAAVLE